ncbi:uncharacterized protein Dana_GF26712 [Drosophila ananassae]|uniref:Tc1-like transposase DDE domain-containing protein n=1 Tax=Drosophila ananassae TaxID=7217 RepID=A0A0P8Y643_DROAN|nr:uncharacterized protein LOC26514121 [Drosophila ananassae]XP_044573672.1 uncharacterized protein LOC26514121 [Drosophila ananassae]KPU74657.1 uncharacterized protein Dana_GF26712 [Drosophila ananassae]
MEDNILTQEMKRHAVIVALHAEHSDLEISTFLKVARSFVYKVRQELQSSGGNVKSTGKRKKHEQRSDCVKTPKFIEQVQDTVDLDPSKSMRAVARDLNVSEGLIRKIVHEDLRYKSYVMRRGQFMSAQTQDQRLIRAKRLLNKLKHPDCPDDHVTPHLWPPSSPDLNPLDYYVWGVLERDTNKYPHNTVASLRTSIAKAMPEMNKDHLIRACKRFRSRIEAVIAANGGFIE